MTFELEITPRTSGRSPIAVEAEFSRELTLEDLPKLEEARDSKANPIKRLSDRHHALARIIAAGQYSNAQAGIITGYDPSRVSILLSDPTFLELIEFYRSMKDEEFRGVHEKLAGVTADALDLIQEHLEDEDKRAKITIGTALEIVKMGADRTGFGPQSTSTQVNIHVGLAERMEKARRTAREAAKTIDVIPNGAIASA